MSNDGLTIGQKFNNLSTGKKAAVIGGAVAGTAAVASVVYAAKKGQVPDSFEGGKVKKVATKLGDGYKQLGTAIKTRAGKALDAIKGIFTKKAPEAEAAAERVVEDAGA